MDYGETTRRMHDRQRGYSNGGNATLDNIEALHAAVGRAPVAMSVQRCETLGPLHARALLHVAGQITPAGVTAAVAESFGNRVRAMTDGLFRPEPSLPQLVTAFVALNTPALRVSDLEHASTAAVAPGLRCLSGNVFSDASDHIWRKHGDMLVQDTDDDLSSVLAQRMSDAVVTASTQLSDGELYRAGDGVMWYDLASEQRRHGLAVASSPNPRQPGWVFAFDVAGSHEDQRRRLQIVPVDPRTVIVASESDGWLEVAMPVLPPPGMPNTTNTLPSNLPSSALPPTGYPMPTPFPTATPVIAPNNGQTGDTPAERLAVQNLIGDREALTPDNMIERHLAYMSVLYSQRGEYFQRLQSLLQGAFRQSLAF